METVTTTLKPDIATCGRRIKLSAIDQIAPRDYVEAHCFLRLNPEADKLRVFRHLETGLYHASLEVPEVLCCVGHSANERDEVELFYHADFGASITYKDYTTGSLRDQWPHGSFDDLEREHFPYDKLDRRLLLGASAQTDAARKPGLVVQANFIEGGMILATCLHHLVCDGSGLFHFHKALAHHVAAAAAGAQPAERNEFERRERHTVVSPEDDVRLEDFPDWMPSLSEDHALKGTYYNPALLPKVKYATYFISEANIKRLRDRLRGVFARPPTTTEAAGAFLWASVLQAREIDTQRYPEAKLSITIDARTRMKNPVVSPTYWGNLSEPNAVARMPTKLLCQPFASEPGRANDTWHTVLPEAALRIKRAIAAVDNVAVRRLVGLLNQMPKATSLTWNVDRWPGPDMLIVCLNKFLFNDLDFGPELGCSEAFRYTVGDTEGKPDGRCLLNPPGKRDGRGLEVALQYDIDTLERLRQSPDFAEYFEWRN